MAQPAIPAPDMDRVPITTGKVTHLVPVVSSSPANDVDSPTSDYYWQDVLSQIESIPAESIRGLSRKFAIAVRDVFDAGKPTFLFAGFRRV